MMGWKTNKQAEQLYMKGGLAAVYPDVYGHGGILAQAGRRPEDFPVDRFRPKKGFKPHWNPPYTGWDQYKKAD
jgi:hypothetical protein